MSYDLGLILDYVVICFFTGGALIAFLYLWKKKRLDFDEEPKEIMLNDDGDLYGR